MRRSEYESARQTHIPVQERFKGIALAIDTALQDLDIKIELYEASGYCFAMYQGDRLLIEGLNPAYANAGDYRRIAIALLEAN